MPDDMAAELGRIAAELRTSGASDDDTTRLLAAVEAVLELADKLDRVDTRLSEMGRESAPVGDLRREMAFSHAKVYEECADMIREAIGREITGKEESDDRSE